MPEIKVTHTRLSIPTRLQLAGIQYRSETRNDCLVFIIDGQVMTPGEAVKRYLDN